MALASHHRSTFLLRLRDKVISRADESLGAILGLYGEVLKCAEVLEQRGKPDDIVRNLFAEIVLGGDEAELAWMSGVLEDFPGVWKKARTESKTSLKERVIEAIGKLSDEDDHTIWEKIAKKLGLKKESIEEAKSRTAPDADTAT